MSNLEAFQELEAKIREVYLLDDLGIVKLIIALVITHRMPSDPVWCFIVGPSSSGKTELINLISKLPEVYPLSSLTPQTLLSGVKKKDKEPSLLLRIPNSIFTIKDFTTILSMQMDVRNELMGQLREVYDGEMTKDFGTGDSKHWKGRMSLIAGVTQKIYLAREMYAAMGERFLMYNFIQADRLLVTERAMENTEEMAGKREMLADATKRFFEQLKLPEKFPAVEPALKKELQALAELATRARSPIERDYHSTQKEITFVYDPEMPMRFAMQETKLATALMALNEGPLAELDKNILYKIALDSIDKRRRLILQILTKYREVNNVDLAVELNYPANSTRRGAEDLTALEVIDRKKEKNRDIWILKPKYRKILSKFEHIEMLNVVLDEDDKRFDEETTGKASETTIEADPQLQAALKIVGGEVI